MNSLTEQILIDIISQEMSLPASSVWIRDQNVLFPNDNNLYIIAGLTSAYPTASESYMIQKVVAGGNAQYQVSEIQQQENIMIDVVSRSNDALTRRVEVLMAMQSFYAQQQQELNNFKIARIPRSFLNTSAAEGGSMLNRYSITIVCNVWYRKEKLLNSPLGDYYDDFKQRVDDEKTIGTPTPQIAFEINS